MSVSSTSDSLVIISGETSKTNEEIKKKPQLPKMKNMHVVSNVRNRYARTVVTSMYSNQDTCAQQATFSIVLPDTAFIAGFVMEIKGKKYEAYVKEKQEAKQEYQEAVARGQAAAHVAVSARDSNYFKVSVNVEPQSDVTFILTYEELLVRKHSKYELLINLHPGHALDDLQVDVHINETRPIINVETPALRSGNEITDKITKNEYVTISKENDQIVHISFHPSVEQQKAMAKALADKKDEKEASQKMPDESKDNGISGQFVIEYDVERDPHGGEVLVNEGYFVHFFAPTNLKPIPKHVIFVLDVSGSMGGRKLKQLKEAMKIILNELNPEDYFNLVKFSDSISVLNNNYSWNNIDIPAESKLPQSFEVNAKNIHSIQKIVDKIEDEGFTNIYDALIIGIRLTSKGIAHLEETTNKHKPQPIVVFLTDGQPNVSESSPSKIIEMVERRNDCDNKTAVFTLAFGDDADKEFLKELAIQNSGFLRNIYEAADASLQLQDFYKQISSPLLTNVNFKYSEEVKNVTKHNFDILINGSEFVVCGMVDEMEDGFVIVEGSTFHGRNEFCPTFFSICPKPEDKEKYGSLERLWAYMTIKQLLNKKYEKFTADNDGNQSEKNIVEEANLKEQSGENEKEKDTAKKQALHLALKYSLVTPITSLIVVKPDEPAVEENLQDSHNEQEMFSDMSVNFMDRNLQINCCAFSAVNKKTLKYQCSPSLPNRLSRRLSYTLSQLFKVKAKNEDPSVQLDLRNIHVECNIKNHVATFLEKRAYVNLYSYPQENTFTIMLPENTILTEFVMEIEEQVYNGIRRDKKHAKKEYKDAVSKNLDAALVNLKEANKVIVSIHTMPHTEIIILLKYIKCLDDKNGKYEVVINLHRGQITEEIEVNVHINETKPIKNVNTPPLRYHNESMNNEYTTINRINDNEVRVEFSPTMEQQEEIVSVLKGTDGNFFGQFILEYEVEEGPTAAGDSVADSAVAVSSPYLVAVRTVN